MHLRSSMRLTSYPHIERLLGAADPIAALFANGEQGAWFDPSDMATLFQDPAGIIPVTGSGQPVGLMLDKSKGLVLGAQLFLGLVSGSWAAPFGTTITANLSYSTGGTIGPIKTGLLTVGKTYLVSYDIYATNGAAVRFQNQDVAGAGAVIAQTASGGSSGTFYIRATAGGLYLRSSIAGTSDITINFLSIREIPGNHAAQAVSASRPTFTIAGGLSSLLTDGVDDFVSGPGILVSENWCVMAGVNITGRRGIGVPIWATTTVVGSDNAMGLYSRTDVVQDVVSGLRIGTGAAFNASRRGDYAIGTAFVAEASHEENSLLARANLGTVSTAAANDDASLISGALLIGSPASPSMHFYGGAFIKRVASAVEKNQMRIYLAAKAGVTL